MQAVIDRAVELLEREVFVEELNEAYAALRADPKAWGEIREERASWDVALEDGLDAAADEPPATSNA